MDIDKVVGLRHDADWNSKWSNMTRREWIAVISAAPLLQAAEPTAPAAPVSIAKCAIVRRGPHGETGRHVRPAGRPGEAGAQQDRHRQSST